MMWIKSSGQAHHSVAHWERSSTANCFVRLPFALQSALLGCCWSWDWVCCCPWLPRSPLTALYSSWIEAAQVAQVWVPCRRWPFLRLPRSSGSAGSGWGSHRTHAREPRYPCWIFQAEWLHGYGVISEETMVNLRIFLFLLRVSEEPWSEDLTVSLKRHVVDFHRQRDSVLHPIIKLISFIATPINRLK